MIGRRSGLGVILTGSPCGRLPEGRRTAGIAPGPGVLGRPFVPGLPTRAIDRARHAQSPGSLFPTMNPSVRNLFDLHRLHAYEQGRIPLDFGQRAGRAVRSAGSPTGAPGRGTSTSRSPSCSSTTARRSTDTDRGSGGEVTDRLSDRPPRHLSSRNSSNALPTTSSRRAWAGRSSPPSRSAIPKLVSRLVFICPSGFYGDESLPMMEGVRRSDYDSLVEVGLPPGPVRHRRAGGRDRQEVPEPRVEEGRPADASGGRSATRSPTCSSQIPHPSLAIWGAEDRVISDVAGSVRAAERILKVRQVVIPKCGHAPQIEKARLVNQLVTPLPQGRASGRSPPSSMRPASSSDRGRRARPMAAPADRPALTAARAGRPASRRVGAGRSCPRRTRRQPRPTSRAPMSDSPPLLQEVLPSRDEDRQPGAEQPMALPGDGRRTSTGTNAGVIVELGAGTGPDHEGPRRAGPARDQASIVLERDPRLLPAPPRAVRDRCPTST